MIQPKNLLINPMFSFGEVLLVLAVALIVLGPKQLPAVAQRIGLWVRHWRAFMAKVQAEFESYQQQQHLAEHETQAKAADELYKKQ